MIEISPAEIQNMICRDRSRCVLRTMLPKGANMITARYIKAIKLSEYKEEGYKARYVIAGHLLIMKEYYEHGVRTIQCASVRILLVTEKSKGSRI